MCKRFDTLLKRRLKDGDEQRGLIVFAESHYEQRAKLWVKGFRELGTQWGLLHSLCDIPYFAPAKESRLLQLADYVAHALFLLFEKQDATLIKEIVKKFCQFPSKNGGDRMKPKMIRWVGWVAILLLAFLVVPLGDRAWWIIPPVGFVLLLVLIVIDVQKPLTPKRVMLAAAMSVAIGVFLKLT